MTKSDELKWLNTSELPAARCNACGGQVFRKNRVLVCENCGEVQRSAVELIYDPS